MSKPKNPDKSREIQAVVARLFAHKGYDATSMREIARELGMNQSSLYHYFRSKEEILFNLANDAMDDALPTLEEICKTDLSAVEKLIAEDKLDPYKIDDYQYLRTLAEDIGWSVGRLKRAIANARVEEVVKAEKASD